MDYIVPSNLATLKKCSDLCIGELQGAKEHKSSLFSLLALGKNMKK